MSPTEILTPAQLNAPRTRRQARRVEQAIQGHIVQWLRWLGPRLGAEWFAVPNGGARSPIEGAIFKGQGVKPGVADLVFIWGGGSACMEVKTKDGRVSAAQIEFRARCDRRGIPYAVVRDIDEAQAAVHGWGLVGKPGGNSSG